MLAPSVVQREEGELEEETGGEDAKPAEEGAEGGVGGDGEDAEVGSKLSSNAHSPVL